MKFNRIRWGITIGCIAIAGIHFWWPSFTLDMTYTVLLVIAVLPWLAPIVKSIELPGGFKIEARDIKEATDKVTGSREVQLHYSHPQGAHSVAPQTLSPEDDNFSTIRQVASTDPNLALVAFRIEIEKRLLALAKKFNINPQRRSVGLLLKDLKLRQIIPSIVASGLSDLVVLGNQAAHGSDVSLDAANWMLEVGPSVIAVLDDVIQKPVDSKDN